MVCNKCGNEVKDGQKFCRVCGNPIEQNLSGSINNESPQKTYSNFEPKTAQEQKPSNTYQNQYTNNTYGKKSLSAPMIAAIIGGFAVIIIVILFVGLNVGVEVDDDGDVVLNIGNSSSENNAKDKTYSNNDDYYAYTTVTVEPTTEQTTRAHTYEIYFSNVSWSQAKSDCISKGGHLVTFDTQEEYEKVINMINQYSIKNIYYIGASRSTNDYNYYWNDGYGNSYGEPINYLGSWLQGEPSFIDKDSGADETCVNLLYKKGVGWALNDIPSDFLSYAPYKSGYIAYVCEFE